MKIEKKIKWNLKSIIFKPDINFTTFVDFLSSPLNSFLISIKNFSTVSYFNSSASKSSNIFFFQTSTDPLCTYDNTYQICSSTATSLIFILIYNLHSVTKLETFDEISSNTCGLAISVLTAIFPAPTLATYIVNTAICS